MLRFVSAIAAVALAIAWSAPARAEDLKAYATKCDAAIGETVKGFDCNAGQEVPEGKDNGKPYGYSRFCDWPNVLNHECDPGSRFQTLVNNDKAIIVAHCRAKRTTQDGLYGDIAVIQYSKVNGATCFYQQLEEESGRLSPNVKAPISGDATWMSPAKTAAIGCGECHDNGPLIRSPYLAHLSDISGATHTLPGSHDSGFNDSQPYAFVGDDFKTWKAYKVEVDGNKCNDCHRMGVSNLNTRSRDASIAAGAAVSDANNPCNVKSSEGGSGTSRMFGILATLPQQCQKLANGHTWMIPSTYKYRKANLDSANQIRDCALAWVAHRALPAGCKVTEFAKAYP